MKGAEADALSARYVDRTGNTLLAVFAHRLGEVRREFAVRFACFGIVLGGLNANGRDF